MEIGSPYRPRVSRETRLLLIAGVMSVAALWLLARIRFPERPVSPNPVPSVLSQLTSGANHDDLAGEIARLHARLQPSLVALSAPSAVVAVRPTSLRTVAIRLRDDVAVTWVPPGSPSERWDGPTLLARDAASGVAVVRLPSSVSTVPLVPWTPGQPQQPRYLAASDVSPAGATLRPVFVGSLDPFDSPLWREPLWAVPRRTELAPGSFLFDNGAELAGLVISYGGGLAIVPGGTVLTEAERLLTAPPGPAGAIGIDVQDLTAPVASVTGAHAGVVVTWVDADGASREQLMAGDVIEAVDGRAVASRQHWDVRAARLSAGELLDLRVRRHGELRQVAVVATAPAAPSAGRSLGLTLRARTPVGAEVVRIDPGTAAERAGLHPGDVITLVANVRAPRPSHVIRSFASMAQGERVIVAVTRGDAHFVTTLER
jgi:hypothetical protein